MVKMNIEGLLEIPYSQNVSAGFRLVCFFVEYDYIGSVLTQFYI